MLEIHIGMESHLRTPDGERRARYQLRKSREIIEAEGLGKHHLNLLLLLLTYHPRS